MIQPRFGELLGRLVHLSSIDVNEILEEQLNNNSRRQFGEIALSWGLCQPEHIWQAWSDQLGDSEQHVDLNKAGIDSQAINQLPAETAKKLGVIPIRMLGDQLVVAVPETISTETLAELRPMLPQGTRFVRAEEAQIAQALSRYYSSEPKAA